MKNQPKIFLLCLALWILPAVARAQSTAFTYNGRLNLNGTPVNGPHEIRFTLYDLDVGGNVIAGPLPPIAATVANGLFTVRIDFGAGIFIGPARWLNVEVRPVGGVFLALTPRQEVTSSPYAIRAETAATVASGSVAANQLNTGGVPPAPGQFLSYDGGNLHWSDPGIIGSNVWSRNGNAVYYNAGNVGVGTSTPAHRLSLSGGPHWTESLWSGAIELQNGAAIAWQANDTGQRFGMGHSFGGFYFFRSASDPGTTGSPAVYDFVINDSGGVGLGTTSPTSGFRLDVNGQALLRSGGSGGGLVSFSAPNGETGMSIGGNNRADLRFDGTTLKLVAAPGSGPPAAESGITISTAGYVGIGKASPGVKLDVSSDTSTAIFGRSTAVSGAGVFGESSQFNGVRGVAHNPNHGGVVGVNDAGGTAVYGTGNIGVHGDSQNPAAYGGYFRNTGGGTAVHAEGNATQARDKGGWVKAMAYIDPFLPADQYVVRCYNSQVNGPAASTPNCGFTVTRFNPGYYRINFGFNVADRFISLTPQSSGLSGGYSSLAAMHVSAATGNTVDISVVGLNGSDNQAIPADTRFHIIVY